MPTTQNALTPVVVPSQQEASNRSTDERQGTGEPRWMQMPVSYAIMNCSAYQARRVMDAFSRLENETGTAVLFVSRTVIVENNSGAFLVQREGAVSIEVLCHVAYGAMQEEGLIIAGDSGYAVSSRNPGEIVKAKVNFYGIGPNTYSGGCPTYPDIEMHEILHAFGFQHVEQYNHIMNPTHAYCPSKVNEDVITKLKEMYLLT